MKKLLILFFFTLITSLTFNSCEIFDQEELVPGFIQINAVNITGELGSGTTSCFDNRIDNVEVFVNNETVGVYPLGTKIPVFQFGEVDFEVFCLVSKSGSSEQLEAHSFLGTIKFSETIEVGEVKELDLSTSYLSSTVVHFEEYFESALNKFGVDLDDFDTTSIQSVSDEFCSDNSVGKVTVWKDAPIMIGTSLEDFRFELPEFGPAYIEFDYKTEVDLVFSISSVDQSGVAFDNIYAVKPRDEWNRIYVNIDQYLLQNEVRTNQAAISAILPVLDENGDSTQIGNAYIDNFRIISF